jgi:hypothetical protein
LITVVQKPHKDIRCDPNIRVKCMVREVENIGIMLAVL